MRSQNHGGIQFIHEDDGRITAVDEEMGVTSFGETKTEALRMLAEALVLYERDDDPVIDMDLEEFGLKLNDVVRKSAEIPRG
ncbi:type II toxin-antitoxin system HicB family antitoxin [Halarchaeum salinum]|uniref:Type II toxin-antitoxin system HicB family antitoxin n=1 Tax=Halarchaeum salinum TaxID=489912 RepID=A0AAV3S5T6_9EURY